MKTALLKACLERFKKYDAWLSKQPLSENTRRAYRSRTNHFLVFLAQSGDEYKDVFASASERDYILKDYKRYLKLSLKMRPTSVNSAITAIDHFYQYLGLPATKIKREELPRAAPRALTPGDQKRFRRACERSPRAIDRAIVFLLLNTGMRIAECAALDVDDVYAQGRKNRVVIRNGKGDRYREIPLNAEACEAITAWLAARTKKFAGKKVDEALFLNPQGKRMSTASIDLIVRKIGRDCGIELSPHILRHTCLTNLVRNGTDLVLVADLAGHKRLETTRRYTLPSESDRERAVAGLIEE